MFPAVTITDRIAASGPTAPFDDGTPGGTLSGTQHVFRYENAIDLESYVATLGSGSTINDVKVVFTEHDDELDLTPNSTTTLTVNGVDPLTASPVKGDFVASTLTPGELSFRNKDFSPGTGFTGFDAIGDLTGHDLDASPQQVRTLSFYIDTDDSNTGSPGVKSMTVITEKSTGEGDRTTDQASSDPFTLALPDPGNFNAWTVIFSDNDILFILDGNSGSAAGNPAVTTAGNVYSGFTFTPTVSTASVPTGTDAPDGTTSLSIASSNAQAGFSGWATEDPVLSLTTDTVYRARLELASPTGLLGKAANTLLLVRFGDPLSTGQNVTQFTAAPSTIFANPAGGREPNNLASAPTSVDVYLLPKAPGNGQLEISTVDQGTGTGANSDIAISGYEIWSAPRSALGAGTVVKNFGNATVAGFTPSSTGLAGFTNGGTTPGVSVNSDTFNGLNTLLPRTLAVTANAITAQHGPEPAGGGGSHWIFSQMKFYTANDLNIDTMDTGFDLTPGRLYLFDVYASTNNAGTQHPFLVTVFDMDHSYQNDCLWWVSGGVGAAGAALTAAPKQYTAVIYPDPDVVTVNPTAKAGVSLAFLHTVDLDLANTTITIHRVVLTEYNIF
jgi:hypothetical protein